MDSLYWFIEFGKVFLGYFFLMFVWPSVVFYKPCRGKSLTFRFAFLVTVQIVLINTVVLGLGLFHILNAWTINLFFYGVFLIAVIRLIPKHRVRLQTLERLFNKQYGRKLFALRIWQTIRECCHKLWEKIWRKWKPHFIEYTLLIFLILFAMVYFSYGAFQDNSYGFGDMYTHHSWIYGLIEGQIFSSGVYPEGMHCFLYTMHTIFGISVYSCNLFLAGIHVLVYVLSAYCMLKELFRWRYSPILSILLFLILKVYCIDGVYSMSRLQWSLPQEFGLFTQFLCAAFMVRYLKSTHHTIKKKTGAPSRFVWDENLLVFFLAVAASFAIHFYTTIMAVLLCVCLAVFLLPKLFRPTHFVPFVTAAVGGIILASIPMVGALASGIEFQGSIGWALSVMDGTDETSNIYGSDDTEETATQASETDTEETADATTSETNGTATNETADATTIETNETDTISATTETATEATESAEATAPKVALSVRLKNAVVKFYNTTFGTLYNEHRFYYAWASLLAGVLWLLYRILMFPLRRLFPNTVLTGNRYDGHAGLLLACLIFFFTYAAPQFGLPALIAGSRLCSTIHLLLTSVMIIPIDMLLSLACECVKKWFSTAFSICAFLGAYAAVVVSGNYHSYLYYELTRYNGAVATTCKIIANYPQYAYTIVSPNDELYQVIEDGRHDDLLTFIEGCSYSQQYTLPTEYVFLFIEKHPIEYAQSHFFAGPGWLAQENYYDYYSSYCSQCPDIEKSSISTLKSYEILAYTNSWDVFTDLSTRSILESKAMEWYKQFSRLYTYETSVYYEDDDFVCYKITQNPQRLFNLALQ
jgi:hypothetical protein